MVVSNLARYAEEDVARLLISTEQVVEVNLPAVTQLKQLSLVVHQFELFELLVDQIVLDLGHDSLTVAAENARIREAARPEHMLLFLDRCYGVAHQRCLASDIVQDERVFVFF